MNREENGLRYHSYKAGKYFRPNDEGENDRLDMQHHIFSLTLSGKLYLSPLSNIKLHDVLDVGTGTGIWAIDFADQHPEAKIKGVDLSPIQPYFIPPNLNFEIDDLEEEWTFNEKFDFIFSRQMTGSFASFEAFFAQAFKFLNPGGYLEVIDGVYPMQCDDGTMKEDSAVKKWADLSLEASIKLGRPVNSALQYKEQFAAAGFVDIVQTEFKWPLNQWPKGKKEKELGIWTRENFLKGSSAGIMMLLTKGLGWTAQEVEAFLVDVRKEITNPSIHAYWRV
jgi:SAM-dependent methyltransferase